MISSKGGLDSLKIFNQKAMKFNYLYFNELEKIKKYLFLFIWKKFQPLKLILKI